MMDEKQRMRTLYRKRARHYDFTANLFYLLGFREWAYRKKAIAALALKPGDTVVELGCGTGINFSLLEKAVGPGGRIIGVDLTDAMLDQARKRAREHGWNNVELIECDAARYEFPNNMDGILATFVMTAVPEYDAVVARAAKVLAPGRRLVILELKRPERTPEWVVRLARIVLEPFGVKPVHATYAPWRSMEKYFGRITMREYYFGVTYIAVGETKHSS